MTEVKNAAPLDTEEAATLDAMKAKMTELRELHGNGIDAIKVDREALNKTTQARQMAFLKAAIDQTRTLMQHDHREVLRQLVEGTGKDDPGIGETLAATDDKRLRQIALLQVGYRADTGKNKGKWVVTANRHKRIADLYRIILRDGWAADELEAKFKAAGGATKLLKANPKRVSIDGSADFDRRKKMVAKDAAALSFEVSDNLEGLEGEFTLAIVSVSGSRVKYHALSSVDDKTRDKLVNGFILTRAEQMLLEQLERNEEAA